MSNQPNSTAPERAAPGRGVLWLGVIVLVAGIVGAIATFLGQRLVYEKSVENLERALPGYRTELEFETGGTFSLYYEHQGTFTTRLDGAETEITLDAPETPPEFDVRLLDSNGEDVRLLSTGSDVSYDVGGFAGSLYRQVEIDQAGRYSLEIVPDVDDSAFALAVGKGTIEEPSVVLPLIIGLIGLGLGLALILLGSARRKRARRAAAAAAAAEQQAAAGYGYGTWPGAGTAPPTTPVPVQAPPGTAPSGPPVTGPPTSPGPVPPPRPASFPPPVPPAPAGPAAEPPAPSPPPSPPSGPWAPPTPPSEDR